MPAQQDERRSRGRHHAGLAHVAAVVVGLASIVLPYTGAQAQAPASTPASEPSADRGRDLAMRFCATCHLAPNATTSVPSGIPSLRAIANKPGQTAQQIEFVLVNPHPPMPDANLTRGEIRDIILFLDTLRSDKAAPPLVLPVDTKPTPAKPS